MEDIVNGFLQLILSEIHFRIIKASMIGQIDQEQ